MFTRSVSVLFRRTQRQYSGRAKIPEFTKTAVKERIAPSQSASSKVSQNANTNTVVEVEKSKISNLYWKPKQFESRTKRQIPEDDILNFLPPPPSHNLNPLIPEHARKEAEILEIMDKHLPKYDILRIPVFANKPIFNYLLYSYMAFVTIGVILFGKWDELSEGEDHVFSGIRAWAFAKWDLFTNVDDEDLKKKIKI